MRKFTYHGGLIAILALLSCHRTTAQDSSLVWVNEIGTQQYFAVLVEDVDQAVAWYSTVFGLTKLGGSVAEDGSWQIENLSNERLQVEIIRDDRAQAVDRARGFRKVGFVVADVEVVADRVERATGEHPRVLDFSQYGIRLIQLRDPEGNIIQLSSSLSSDE